MRALVLALLLAVGALAGCSDDGGGSTEPGPGSSLIPPESTESADAQTSGSASTDTTSTAPTTTAPSTPTAHTAAARDAVNELKAAWEAGDRPRAAAIAPGDVVDALFAVPPGGFEVYGCDTGEFDTSTCNLRNRSTEAFIVVTAARSAAGWQISTIDVNAD